MQRVDAPEILDSENCPPQEIRAALQTLDRINRWFGGVSTTQNLIERATAGAGKKYLSLLEVAAGSGKVPEIVRQRLAARGINLNVVLLDRVRSHLPATTSAHKKTSRLSSPHDAVVADALALPFGDETFDVVSCNLFAHHLTPAQLVQFVGEALRVSRRGLLINDLVRHPLHLALVYASYPIMGSRVAWLDGLTSVRRAYIPDEIGEIVMSALPAGCAPRLEIYRHFLFRMGFIVWKNNVC